MTQADRDRRAYALAREYLLGRLGMTAELLAEYQKPPPDPPSDFSGLYRRLLQSAKSPGMTPNVIKRHIGDFERLEAPTFGFDPFKVLQHYSSARELLDGIIRTLRVTSAIRCSPSSLWVRFCNSAFSGASFLVGFGSAQEFYAWANAFHDDDRMVAALPLLVSKEILGFGFALACDFLMDLGYPKLTKPDVHVKAIVEGLGLCEPKADDYAVYKCVVRIARHQGTTPYDVGQTFWLVGSGHLYRHPDKPRIKTDRDEFIRWAVPLL